MAAEGLDAPSGQQAREVRPYRVRGATITITRRQAP